MSITYLVAYRDTFLNDFCSKCDQIREYLKIYSHLLKKFLMEKSPFVQCTMQICENYGNIARRKMCSILVFSDPYLLV